MAELTFLVTDAAEGGYDARAIGASIFTQGADAAELRRMVREAVHAHFDDDARPPEVRLRFVHDETLHV